MVFFLVPNRCSPESTTSKTKQWDVILKENKANEYIPILTAKIVYSRMPDEDIMTIKEHLTKCN